MEHQIKVDNEDKNNIELQLGDIIEIYAPKNSSLHQNIYYIDYIDGTKIDVINTINIEKTTLHISKDGFLRDESILSMLLLNRADEEGYARQHNLLPHTWIDIHIGGELPGVIIGEITNLEEDMIEVTTHPDKQIIYINFDYKGIPQNIPFEKFNIREKPEIQKYNDDDEDEEKIIQSDGSEANEASIEYTEEGDMIINIPENAVPDEDMKDTLSAIYRDADEIVFGEELEDIVQKVELPEQFKTYSIEVQTNDMMDELLSTIPNSKRSKKVMQNIHVLIERFKQLRQHFSNFDEQENVKSHIYHGHNYKPLIDKIKQLKLKLHWIVPVVTFRKRIYLGENDDDNDEDTMAKNVANNTNDIEFLKECVNNYENATNSDRYNTLYNEMDEIKAFDSANVDSNNVIFDTNVVEDLDAVVDSLGNFESIVVRSGKDNAYGANNAKFVIQRYNTGLTKKSKTVANSGRTIYFRSQMTPDDNIMLKSLLFLPEKMMNFSKITLPGTKIYDRVKIHENFMYLSKVFQRNSISSHIVDDFTKEMKDGDDVLTNIQHYTLDDEFNEEEDKMDKFLSTVVPNTFDIVKRMENVIKNKMSLLSVIKELEPFAIYNTDIAYSHFKGIRYFINKSMETYKKEFVEKSQHYQGFRNMKNQEISFRNVIRDMFIENNELLEMFTDGYKITSEKLSKTNIHELLNDIYNKDHCKLLYNIITFMSIKTLNTPEDLLRAFEPAQLDDMSGKIKPKDCTRRYLTKHYNSLKELDNDQNKDEVYYDEDMDDTPYDLLKLYQSEKKSMNDSEFKEFLIENLISKHNVESKVADEIANTLIAGKKQVKDGEYAMLLVKPSLPPHIDIHSLSDKEMENIEIEKSIREKRSYYYRVKNQWVKDSTISPENFIDSNTLFCNLRKDCFKNQTNQQCETNDYTKRRLLELTKSRMIKEFDDRVHLSLEQLEQKIKKSLAADFKNIKKIAFLEENRLNKYNNYAFELGKIATVSDAVLSPYISLRDSVLGNDDFVDRQNDVLRFIDTCCREPMQDVEMNEDQYYYYCKETNTKLLPMFYGTLAKAFQNNTYLQTLQQLCSTIGTLSDDGDAIVDKHSGDILRKIDFVVEDEYTEDGFKIKSHDVLQDELETKNNASLNKKSKNIVFENELNEDIHKILSSICIQMGIPLESIDDFTKRMILAMMVNIQSSEKYEEVALKMKKRPIPYEIYKNRFMFWIIGACIIIAVQVKIPSMKIKKVFPGCVQSFSGYPLNGIEDLTGIEYMGCVLFKMKSSIYPWNSIEKLDQATCSKKIKETIELFLMKNMEIQNAYLEKRKYLVQHPNEAIPDELDVAKWTGFMPPIVKFEMPSLRTVTKDFEKNLIDEVKSGSKLQHQSLNIMKGKINAYGYSIINDIKKIVMDQDPILQTVSKIPFLENACCNENRLHIMQYFANENENIRQNIKVIKELQEFHNHVTEHGKASTLYHNEFTGIEHVQLNETYNDDIIYSTIIDYCNLNKDLPIPDDLLFLFSEKPVNFPQNGEISEQIEFLKREGKQMNKSNLAQMLHVVHNRGKFTVDHKIIDNQIDAIHDILTRLEQSNSKIVEKRCRDHLQAVLAKYDPRVMVHEERDELKKFKNYLARANENLYNEIVDFFDNYGNLNDIDFGKLQDHLLGVFDMDMSSRETIYNSVNFIENNIYNMTKLFPNILQKGKYFSMVPDHWNVSEYHRGDIHDFVDNYWKFANGYKEDATMNVILSDIQNQLRDIHLLMTTLPIQTSIMKKGVSYYSFLDNDGIQLLYVYFYYSCIYQYIVCGHDETYVSIDIYNKKSMRRNLIDEDKDPSLDNTGLDEPVEVDVLLGNSEDLKQRIAGLLLSYLNVEKNNMQFLQDYDSISKKIRKQKIIEKTKMTTFFGNIEDNFERKLEDQFKKYKLGSWNIGMQKALVQYDKELYDKERIAPEMDSDHFVYETEEYDENIFDEEYDNNLFENE